jgi:putative tributyrin esterase
MAVCEIHLTSQNALQKMTSFMAILPEGKSGPFPVFYLLHGLSDDHTAWTRRTSIERYVQDLPLIVVMPNAERSFYSDSQAVPTSRFETFITQDLISFVDTTFNTIPLREGRVVAGLSMGGYGAFKFALKYPQLFGAAVSHSGALSRPTSILDNDDPDWVREMRAISGDNAAGSDNDLYALAEKIERAQLPALRFDCGTEDFLIEHNRDFHRHLKALNIVHEYQEFSGEHNWEYWDEHIRETVRFFARHLELNGN